MPTLYERRIRRVINRIRREHDLVPVRFDRAANEIAAAWASRLKREGAFYHNDMGAVLDHCGAQVAGEILGRGEVGPKAFGRLWLASPPHRHVMLNPVYRRVGVAVVQTELGHLVVVNFIRR